MDFGAGNLDRRVTIQRATRAKNTRGVLVDTWGDLATVWASYRALSDAERIRSAEVAAVIEARFRIRWSPGVADVTAKDRLQFEGRPQEIVAVKPIGRRKWIEISTAARSDA